MNNLYFRALRSSIFGFIVMAALLFVPAGTLDYWQAFVFMAVFVGASAAITVYLAKQDPQLLERRMNVGPTAEKETTQKIIMVFALLGFIALLVVPAFDRIAFYPPKPGGNQAPKKSPKWRQGDKTCWTKPWSAVQLRLCRL